MGLSNRCLATQANRGLRAKQAPATRFNGFFVTLLSRRPIVKSEGQIDAPGFLGQDLPRRQLSERSQEIRAFDASYEQARDPERPLTTPTDSQIDTIQYIEPRYVFASRVTIQTLRTFPSPEAEANKAGSDSLSARAAVRGRRFVRCRSHKRSQSRLQVIATVPHIETLNLHSPAVKHDCFPTGLLGCNF